MQTNLGSSILNEKLRFRSVLTGVPDRPGHGRYIEVNGGEGSLQGTASEQSGPGKEDSWFVNTDSIQVLYQTKYPDASEAIVTRMIMYAKDDHSNPELWKRETWHRDTVVRERDGAVLGDECRHTTAVYPGRGGARDGVIVSDEKLPELPLNTRQHSSLTLWNIVQ